MNGYMDFLPALAAEDVTILSKKDAEYGGSWKKRGGVGAFMMAARKMDRIEEQLKKAPAYDIFTHALQDRRPEGILDDIADLRRYLLLIEAEIRAQRAAAEPGSPPIGRLDSLSGTRLVPRHIPANVHIDETGQGRPFGFNAEEAP